MALDPHPIWPYLVWGARVLVARGEIEPALACLQAHGGITAPEAATARFCEEALLQAGRQTDAYERFAIWPIRLWAPAPTQANSHLATYPAIAKKYPQVDADRVLSCGQSQLAATPGETRSRPSTDIQKNGFAAWKQPSNTAKVSKSEAGIAQMVQFSEPIRVVGAACAIRR